MSLPSHVLGRARQRFAGSAALATLSDLDFPPDRRLAMLAAFAVGIANGNQAFPRAFLREVAGSPLWEAGLRTLLERLILVPFDLPEEVLADMQPYPVGTVDGDEIYMGNHRQKALARCVHSGLLYGIEREGGEINLPDETRLFAEFREAYAVRIDEINGRPAEVFRRHSVSPGVPPWGDEPIAVLS